jgi:putative CocE/NonD family hydrolase
MPGQWAEVLRFFNHHLLDQPHARFEEKVLFYYTLGAERWQRTQSWPPAGFQQQRYYLGENGSLTAEAPTAEMGADEYRVDFSATTGSSNRWHTPDGVTAVVYGDRAQADKKLLTYTSEPVVEDREITGHPLVTLYLSSTATDGAFYVYLEAVDERGKVTYLSEGQLRAIHRQVLTAVPPYQTFGPYHTFKKEDAQPLVPGEVTELSFALLPISVVIKKGNCLRLAIAGHDKDTFVPIPEHGVPTISVQRSTVYASYIELPMKAPKFT